jgi:hypothetical protein
MRPKYQDGLKAMRSTLESLFEIAREKFVYEHLIRDLQISNIEKYKGDSVSLKLVNDAFTSIETYLPMSDLKRISKTNFSKFKPNLDEEWFNSMSSQKALYENFVGTLSIFQDLFDYEIDHMDEKLMTVISKPTDTLLDSYGHSYDNDLILIQRMFFAAEGNTLNGHHPADVKILNSTLQGDKYTKFSLGYH